MQEFKKVTLEVKDNVGIMRLNDPGAMNAVSDEMLEGLWDCLNAVEEKESNIKCLVFTGEGRGFCAGADIEAVFKAQADGKDTGNSGGTRDWVNQIRESKPMVAAINGAAVGVGLTQVLPMDYLIASDQAKLSMRFVKMGLVPELASSHFLASRLGFRVNPK